MNTFVKFVMKGGRAMLKKLTSVFLSLAIAAAMTSCGNVADEKSSKEKSEIEITTEAEPEDTTVAVTTTKRRPKTTTTTKKVTTTAVTTVTTTAKPTEPPTEPPTAPPTEPPTEPEPEIVQVSYKQRNDLSVPDFDEFIYNRQLYDITKDSDGYNYHDIVLKKADEAIALEYVSLLQNDYNFELICDRSLQGPYISKTFYYYYFRHNGGSGVQTFTEDTHSDYGTIDTDLYFSYTYNDGELEVYIHCAYGLDYDDYGDRTAYLEPDTSSAGDSGGSSSGGGYSYDWENNDDFKPKFTITCSKCHGKGKITCTQCNGRGYMHSYIQTPNYSGDTTPYNSYDAGDTCNKCHGLKEIECTECGGSGKITRSGG